MGDVAAGDGDDDQLEQRAELETLKLLDEKAVKLQKDGKYMDALTCMERGLVMRQHFFGSDSEVGTHARGRKEESKSLLCC